MYGAKTEGAFVKSWGVGLGIKNATEFKELLTSLGQTFLMLMAFDLLLTPAPRWFEDHGAPQCSFVSSCSDAT